MKKLIVFILSLAMMLSLAGCQYLPEDAQSKLEDIKNGITETDEEGHYRLEKFRNPNPIY